MKTIDVTGKKFGALLVREFSHIDKHSRAIWLCQCECGNPFLTAGIQLRKGAAKSCGCLWKQHLREVNTTHGLLNTPEYRAWSGLKARCLNPHTHNYTDYGGRGITICERWMSSFETFLSDMGKRPSPSHSLDRREVNGNYEPSNCRWATKKEQTDNRRKMGNLSRFSIEELTTEMNLRITEYGIGVAC